MELAQVLDYADDAGDAAAGAGQPSSPPYERRGEPCRDFAALARRLRGKRSLQSFVATLRAALCVDAASLWVLDRDSGGGGRLVCRASDEAEGAGQDSCANRLGLLHGSRLSSYLLELAYSGGQMRPDGRFAACAATDPNGPCAGDLDVLVAVGGESLGIFSVAGGAADAAAYQERLALCQFASAECAALLMHQRALDRRQGARAAGPGQYDPVTGLPGREMGETLFEALRRAAAGHVHALFVDIGNFAFLSATLGQTAADHILVHAADRLRAAVGSMARIVHYGDDRFLVLTAGQDEAELAALSDGMLAALDMPIDSTHEIVCVTTNIGTATSNHAADAESADRPYLALLRRAEVALRRAKEGGPGVGIAYGHELGMSLKRSAQLESHLKAALKLDEIGIVIQPQVDCATGRVTGGEALARWHSSALGEISPAMFIPVAEGSTLIHALGLHVLELVCREIVRRGPLAVPIAVNVSARQLLSRDFVGNLVDMLHGHGLVPGNLELEITESALVEVGAAADNAIARLSDLGFPIVMDDFGTGYSNLSLLKDQPISKIKLDGSLLENVPRNTKDSAIVAAALQMAHTLGAQVVAERVENVAQFDFLRALGCDAAQGYLISRPAPPQDFWALSTARFDAGNAAAPGTFGPAPD